MSALTITRLNSDDQPRWTALWHGYRTFYKSPQSAENYAATWRRVLQGDPIRAYGARLDGTLVGITHYLFHPSTWMDDVCYLQDLFTDETVRGQGIGRALIEAVAAEARSRGAPRLYWQTHETNATARLLYDRLAHHGGFIRYDYPMG